MKKICPLIKDECAEHGCHWYINVQGVHPQTGEQLNQWDCAIVWIPVLTIDVARQARSGAAATESFRNEMAKANSGLIMIQEFAKQQNKLIEG